MSEKKMRWLRKLVHNQDPNLLLSIRNMYGPATQKMDSNGIYKAAKKLLKKYGGRDKWGKTELKTSL